MTDRRRPNPTQDALDASVSVRAYNGIVAAIAVREAIRPLERRRLRRLAALVTLTPCVPRD